MSPNGTKSARRGLSFLFTHQLVLDGVDQRQQRAAPGDFGHQDGAAVADPVRIDMLAGSSVVLRYGEVDASRQCTAAILPNSRS